MFDIRRLFAVRGAERAQSPAVRDALRALRAERYEEALDRLDGILAASPVPGERAFAHNKRGVALIALGRRDEALAAFSAALATVDGYPAALVNIGNLRLEEGALDDAIELYRAALRSDEDYAVAHLNLGTALKRAGHTAEGVRHLRTAQRLEGRRRS
jgi:tetratricopeptide (TPR) repeat protein